MMPDVILKYIPNKRGYMSKRWHVCKSIEVVLSDGRKITIPAGFKTDLSSVPRLLWALFPPYGDFLVAAIAHDWMYIEDYRRDELGIKAARKYADKQMFYLSCLYNPNGVIDNYLRYLAVRIFGGYIYKK